MALYLLYYVIVSLPNLTIILAPYLLLTFAIPCAHKNKSCAWAADNFPPVDMAFLPTVL